MRRFFRCTVPKCLDTNLRRDSLSSLGYLNLLCQGQPWLLYSEEWEQPNSDTPLKTRKPKRLKPRHQARCYGKACVIACGYVSIRWMLKRAIVSGFRKILGKAETLPIRRSNKMKKLTASLVSILALVQSGASPWSVRP
jgi:hypothetical protein